MNFQRHWVNAFFHTETMARRGIGAGERKIRKSRMPYAIRKFFIGNSGNSIRASRWMGKMNDGCRTRKFETKRRALAGVLGSTSLALTQTPRENSRSCSAANHSTHRNPPLL